MHDADEDMVDHNPREPLRGFVNVARSVFFLSASVLLCVTIYLVWNNPSVNYSLAQKQIQEQIANVEENRADSGEWTYDYFSDVDISDVRYPIVVLRTGFKVIRTAPERSLVGWKYELVNTSAQTRYVPSVTFDLQDADGFNIASSDADTIVQPEAYGAITGTVEIENIDIERLSQSRWTIRLSPSWDISEEDTQEDRYTRLEALAESTLPLWVRDFANQDVLGSISPKWKAIQTGLGIEPTGQAVDEAKQLE